MNTYKASIKFPTREMAQEFATHYTRFSHEWSYISAGKKNVIVVFYNVTPQGKIWINDYISKINDYKLLTK